MIKTKIFDDIVACLKKLDIRYNKKFTVEIPNVAEHGDFSTNAAMVIAKLNDMNPRYLATQICELMQKGKNYKSVEIAGPGFINFKMANSVYHKNLIEIVKAKSNYGSSDYGKNQKVLLEFISANPTGPLNVVSARAGAYGDSLARIMNYIGFEAFKEFYVNDAGNQVDILGESMEIRYRELHGDKLEELPEEVYHGEYIKDLAAQLNSIDGSKLFHIAEKDRLERMQNFALEAIHNMQVESLDNFDVKFDNWMSEKKLRAEGMLEEALSYLAEANCTYEKDDAVWFCSSQFGDEKDRVLIKTDGNPTYLVPDIAYHLTKYQRGFEVIVDVLGPDHHGHVAKLRAAMLALEMEVDKLEIVYLQHINLIQDGETVKMSKRAGKIVSLDELIAEVGKDAARYFFVNRKPSAHLDFDLELAKKKSSENPVYYCQYAHARINSTIKKAKKEKITLKDFDLKKLKKLDKDIELKLIKKMLDLPSILAASADHREPHRLAGYVHELAGLFHKYYGKYTFVDAKHKELSQSRLYLISAVMNVLAISLNLLGVSAPDKM
jgi:arginyl-tRNA synthetase